MHRRILIALLLAPWFAPQAAVCAEMIFSHDVEGIAFSIQQRPGTGGWLSARLDIDGKFTLYGSPHPVSGVLSRPQCRRIFEEFGKVWVSAGLDNSAPPPQPRGGRLKLRSLFVCGRGLQGQVFEIESLEAPVPPHVADFVTFLWYKLNNESSKKTEPALEPGLLLLPPLPVVRPPVVAPIILR